MKTPEKTVRSLTPAQIAETVTETVTKTETDLKRYGSILKMFAATIVQACLLLQRDPDIEIVEDKPGVQSRGLKTKAWALEAVDALKTSAR